MKSLGDADPTRKKQSSPRSQEGSAYILSLLVLLVVSGLALATVFAAGIEVELGNAERTIQRSFYASDSGLATTAARVLAAADYAPQTIVIDDGAAFGNVRQEVEVSPILPIRITSCNLCEINNAGTYAEDSYQFISHAVTSQARRIAGPANEEIASKSLTSMIDLQPWKTPAEALVPVTDPAQLAKVKY